MKVQFATKGIYMTCGIQNAMKETEIDFFWVQDCIQRHFRNDGEECKEDRNMNQWCIDHKDGRVVSIFTDENDTKIYIITDGLHLANDPEHGKQYPMTTILFPEEY